MKGMNATEYLAETIERYRQENDFAYRSLKAEILRALADCGMEKENENIPTGFKVAA